ncbi:unnamed protein product [Hymenolepis diminuta]|uniref:Transcriptional regulator n=1 Tax=Hymenolepis diminuta TaxID=6216 RepID=A0A0R3SFY0_HYMDI|nr:unnamed protein product [Hymenolepis diminuta]
MHAPGYSALTPPCRVDYELKVFVVDEDGSRAQKR